MSLLVKPQLIEFDELETADGILVQLHNAWNHWLFAVSGEGMPPIDWLTDTGPFQDGSSIRDFRLRPRILQYFIRWDKACDRPEYWALRRDLINVVRPNRSASGGRFAQLTLRKRFPFGTSGPTALEIQAVIERGPDFKARDRNVWDERAFNETLRFVAFDPIWVDVTSKSVQSVFEQALELQFPIQFDDDEIVFGGGTLNQDVIATNAGTWKVYPTIVLTGPINCPTITNQTTGESIDLDYEIPVGRTVTIDLAYGIKTVQDDLGTNLIGTVTPDSELADFHLAPHPEAANGQNTINIVASGLDSASQIRLNWNDRYIGY